MILDPDVQAQLDEGRIVVLDLIRFDLPGNAIGYHRGGRPYTWNGLTYRPNRWMDIGDMTGSLGVAVSKRTIRFSNVPTDDPDDAIAKLEESAYVNAPVIVAHLAGDPDTDTALGILASSLYQIDQVRYATGATDASGQKTVSIEIDLEPPGRSARGATGVKNSQIEHQHDFDATDTAFEYASTVQTVKVEWGQLRG